MCNQNEWIVREAFLAYDRGDVERMMEFVAPDLEWTHVDPSSADPRPLTHRSREELAKALSRQAEWGLHAELEHVIAFGNKVLLVMRTPGVDEYRHREGEDRTYDVVTLRDGLIVGVHACRDRGEARSLAGIG
ncbi:MAG: nuclear transport factor 2 family protein [Streptosporangiaceae bacterium]|nr:nuclear transport factor 2 family protein [Streptosporangiaceae bacterium]